MALTFDASAQAEIQSLLGRYPNKMAATLPVLWIAQRAFGHLSVEALDLVAKTLDLPPSHVYGVVTFYTMYNKNPVGRFHVQVCTNVACMLRGAYKTLARFEELLKLKAGQTDADKQFTLTEVECLAACGGGPAVQVNEKYYELVSPDRVDALVDALRSGTLPPGAELHTEGCGHARGAA